MLEFDRVTVVTALVVFLVVGTVGMLGATINSVQGANDTVSDFSVDQNIGDTSASNVTGGDSDGAIPEGSDGVTLSTCISFLQTPSAIAGIVAAIAGAVYGVSRRYNRAASLIFGAVFVPVVWIAYFLSTNCATGGSNGGGGLNLGNALATNTGGPTAPPASPVLIAGVFSVVVIGGIALLVVTTGEEETFEPTEEEPTEVETTAFAEAAGRAADRIDETNASVDNAVYEAWLEMTTLLRMNNPSSTAPRDFADAAVNAGLDRGDIEELTQLFNEVRYGNKEVETREERALEILRNIERIYEESGDGATDSEKTGSSPVDPNNTGNEEGDK
jgi:hypothetical protein